VVIVIGFPFKGSPNFGKPEEWLAQRGRNAQHPELRKTTTAEMTRLWV
jgi:hypothetical protein